MRRPGRNLSPELKAWVDPAANQGDPTMPEVVKKFEIHANQATDWNKQPIGGAPNIFGKGV